MQCVSFVVFHVFVRSKRKTSLRRPPAARRSTRSRAVGARETGETSRVTIRDERGRATRLHGTFWHINHYIIIGISSNVCSFLFERAHPEEAPNKSYEHCSCSKMSYMINNITQQQLISLTRQDVAIPQARGDSNMSRPLFPTFVSHVHETSSMNSVKSDLPRCRLLSKRDTTNMLLTS